MDTTDVRDNPDRRRYELMVDGHVAAHLQYRLRDGSIDLVHTEVDRSHEGKGLGGRVVAYALAEARRRGLRVVPSCSYVAAYVRKHPEWLELVDEGHRETLQRR